MADKAVPPKGARLLPVSGQDDLFTLQGYLSKTPVDGNWHNYRDFDRVLSTGVIVLATDGKKWLTAEGYNGENKSFTGYLLYEDRDKLWYDLPTAVTPVPRAPTGVIAKANSWSSIDVAWTSPDGAAVEIERTDDLRNAFVKIATGSGTDKFYNDKNLAGSTPYYYRVRCVSEGGNSEYTGPVKETTMVKEVTPAPTPTPTPVTTLPVTPDPVYIQVPVPAPTPAVVQQPKQDWISANLNLVLIGGCALLVVLFVVLGNRD